VAPDSQADIGHTVADQITAINGGKMNGFNLITGCGSATHYACYDTQSQRGIPNLWALASRFAISDNTFALSPVPSWAAHEELVTGLLDGFQGDIPTGARGGGWGCNSGGQEGWSTTAKPPWKPEPSCIPAPSGSRAASKEPADVKASPVKWIPTIMDRLTQAGDLEDLWEQGQLVDLPHVCRLPVFQRAVQLGKSQTGAVRRRRREVAQLLRPYSIGRRQRRHEPAPAEFNDRR